MESRFNITSARYITNMFGDNCTIIITLADGKTRHVPLDPANTTYAEIMRQVDEGTLTIQDAD